MGGESRPTRSGEGFDAGVLNRRGILGPGLFPPASDGDRCFLAGVGAGGGGGGSPWPMPLSGLVLQLAAESPPRGEAPSVLRRRLSSSVEANDMSRSKPLLILSCHLSTLRSPTSSSSPSVGTNQSAHVPSTHLTNRTRAHISRIHSTFQLLNTFILNPVGNILICWILSSNNQIYNQI